MSNFRLSMLLVYVTALLFCLCSCRQENQPQADLTIQSKQRPTPIGIQEELEEKFGSPSSAFYRGFNAGKGAVQKKNVDRLWEIFTQSTDPTAVEITDEYILGNNSCMPLGWEVEFTLTSKSGKDTIVEFKLNDEKFALGLVDGEVVYFLFITQNSYEDILELIGGKGRTKQKGQEP